MPFLAAFLADLLSTHGKTAIFIMRCVCKEVKMVNEKITVDRPEITSAKNRLSGRPYENPVNSVVAAMVR